MALWPPHVTLLRDYKDLAEHVSTLKRETN